MRLIKEEEAPRGFDYQPGLHLVPDLSDDAEYRWQNEALCHGLYEVFDLVDGQGQGDASAAHENKYRLKAARKICFECPVFQDCWDDAFMTLPRSVIRAGARLSNGFAKTREEKLLTSYALWQEHKSKKEHTAS